MFHILFVIFKFFLSIKNHWYQKLVFNIIIKWDVWYFPKLHIKTLNAGYCLMNLICFPLQIFHFPSFLDLIMSYRKMDKHGSPQYCRHFLADNSIFHGRSLLRIVDIVMEHCYISLNLYKCSEGGFSLHHLQKKCSWHFYTQGGALSHIMRIVKFTLLIVWELAPTEQKRKKIIPCWLDDIWLNWQLALNSNITTTSITNGNRWFQHEGLSPACLYTIWEDKVADVLNKQNISTLLMLKVIPYIVLDRCWWLLNASLRSSPVGHMKRSSAPSSSHLLRCWVGLIGVIKTTKGCFKTIPN